MAKEFYLKIDTIVGESIKTGFENQIEIDSYGWGAQQAVSASTGTGTGAGKVDMQPFQFSCSVSKASPKLMLACATGQHIPSAVLTLRKAGGTQESYLTWTLTNVVVSSYHQSGSDGADAIPTETFSLAFDKIQVEYKPQDAQGKLGAAVTTGYDLKAMSKV